jgi:hypothetical protein
MDNLQYIRDAIRDGGHNSQVSVVRWELNPTTGAQDHAFEFQVNARIALRELQKPINKRSYSWAKVRPVGDVIVGKTISAGGDMNSLSNPELLSKLKEELKAQVRAELEAELAAKPEETEKPKRKKKEVVEDDSLIASPSESPFYTEEQLNNLPL